MKIEAVDLFYLSMPEVLDIGDGSQDALLVRIAAGDWVGWGECEAAPLVCIASFVCPMSHSACKPLRDSVLGQRINVVEDIGKISRAVHENSFDLLQADHMLSGIDMALYDLLGRRFSEPVYRLLGYHKPFPKTPYASQLFGDAPEDTYERAVSAREAGYRAAKFGWGPYGKSSVKADADQVRAAREGLGPDATLLVDAGTVWGEDVEQAAQRLPALEECGAVWLEEPFVSGAFASYKSLAARSSKVRIAGGEGCSNVHAARNMIDHANVGFIQIDAGRVGGITAAKQVADYANQRGVTYVNHTFTTQLALSASIQPYAGLENHTICEVPFHPKPLARNLTKEQFELNAEGQIHVHETPGLGVTVDLDTVRRYLKETAIVFEGDVLYSTPEI